MKALIIATCIAVLAACCVVITWGGYFGWGEFRRYTALQAATRAEHARILEESANNQRAEKERQASQKKTNCLDIIAEIKDRAKGGYPRERVAPINLKAAVDACLEDGKVDPADVADIRDYF